MKVLTDEELVAHGEALHALRTSEGWGVFMQMLERHCNEVGKVALRDAENSRDYWRGRLEAIEALIAECQTLEKIYVDRAKADDSLAEAVHRDVLSQPGSGVLA